MVESSLTSSILAGCAIDSSQSGSTYYAKVCVAQSTGITFLARSAIHVAVGFLHEIQLFSSDSHLSFGVSLIGFGQGKGFLLSEDGLCWRISTISG